MGFVEKTDTHIQFPEAAEALDAQKNHKDVPISCKGQNYCTVKTDDYPEDKFNEMFKGYVSKGFIPVKNH